MRYPSMILARRDAQALIEALIAFTILVFVIVMLYQAIVLSTRAGSVSRTKLSAHKFVEMEMERISATDYDHLPPERHTLTARKESDGIKRCTLELQHTPIDGTVDVYSASGVPLAPDILWQLVGNRLIIPFEMSGKDIFVNYAFEYPRSVLLTIPKEPPYDLKISGSLREVMRVVDTDGKALQVSVAKKYGRLSFKPQDAGRSVNVDYRGESDRGRVDCKFLSSDLSTDSGTDQGIKLVTLTEYWADSAGEKKVALNYVRAR